MQRVAADASTWLKLERAFGNALDLGMRMALFQMGLYVWLSVAIARRIDHIKMRADRCITKNRLSRKSSRKTKIYAPDVAQFYLQEVVVVTDVDIESAEFEHWQNKSG